MALAQLPAASDQAKVRLPQTYEHAKTALAECAKIDECQTWADKAAALASYAKQANDDALMKMAVRIRDRAIRRAGELLKLFTAENGARLDLSPRVPGHPRSQMEAGFDANMSGGQVKTAVRVANIPAEEFERLVESDDPPTAKKLAELGKRPTQRVIDLTNGRDPEAFNRSLHFVAEFEDYAKSLAKFDLDLILPGLSADEARRVHAAIGSIDATHDTIMTRI